MGVRVLKGGGQLLAHGGMQKLFLFGRLDHQIKERLDFRVDVFRPVHDIKADGLIAFRGAAHLAADLVALFLVDPGEVVVERSI